MIFLGRYKVSLSLAALPASHIAFREEENTSIEKWNLKKFQIRNIGWISIQYGTNLKLSQSLINREKRDVDADKRLKSRWSRPNISQLHNYICISLGMKEFSVQKLFCNSHRKTERYATHRHQDVVPPNPSINGVHKCNSNVNIPSWCWYPLN